MYLLQRKSKENLKEFNKWTQSSAARHSLFIHGHLHVWFFEFRKCRCLNRLIDIFVEINGLGRASLNEAIVPA